MTFPLSLKRSMTWADLGTEMPAWPPENISPNTSRMGTLPDPIVSDALWTRRNNSRSN
jgi:hypothetical protein